MKLVTMSSMLFLLSGAVPLARAAETSPAMPPPAATAPALHPSSLQGGDGEPQTITQGLPRGPAGISGWFVAPTLATTGFGGALAYSPGLRAGLYLNRRVGVGLAVNGLGTSESAFEAHRVRNVGLYEGLLLQYVVQSNRLLHITLESTLGTGNWCVEISDQQDGCHGRRFLAVEPVANVELNVARHARLFAGAGYRFAVAGTGEGPSSRDMSSLVVRTGLALGSF